MRKNMTEEKWSSHVGHLEEGGLHGWCASCPPEERHRAIERTVRTDGYATAIRRLNFLANVANRHDNEHLHQRRPGGPRVGRASGRRRRGRTRTVGGSGEPSTGSADSSGKSRGGGNASDHTSRETQGGADGPHRFSGVRPSGRCTGCLPWGSVSDNSSSLPRSRIPLAWNHVVLSGASRTLSGLGLSRSLSDSRTILETRRSSRCALAVRASSAGSSPSTFRSGRPKKRSASTSRSRCGASREVRISPFGPQDTRKLERWTLTIIGYSHRNRPVTLQWPGDLGRYTDGFATDIPNPPSR